MCLPCPFMLTAAAAVVVAAGSSDHCTLADLRVWDGGSPLQLDPPFSAKVRDYTASPLDYEAKPVWVEPVPDGAGCEARRSDKGQTVTAGGRGEVAVSVNGTKPCTYTVALTRRTGRDDSLAELAVRGAALSPSFQPGVHHYDLHVASGRGEVVLVVAPTDMGQALEVSVKGESGHWASSPELPSDLQSLRYRRRNFTLLGPDTGHQLPLQVAVRIWPPAANGASVGTGAARGPPARTYAVSVKAEASGNGGRFNFEPRNLLVPSMASLLFCGLLGIIKVHTLPLRSEKGPSAPSEPLVGAS